MKFDSSHLWSTLVPHFKEDDIVVVAPLNWGLGHAARCIPLIELLIQHCKEIIIASDGNALLLLRKQFPDLRHYELPSYDIKYFGNNMIVNMVRMIPRILKTSKAEHTLANKICSETNATVVLSDNRFGFYYNYSSNYYLTHQTHIHHSNNMLSYLASKIHQNIIRKFDLCFIPDYGVSNISLAGDLSKPIFNLRCIYLGPISRIKKRTLPKIWDICALITGPEPQRSIFESKLFELLAQKNDKKVIFVRGIRLGEARSYQFPSHMEERFMVDSDEMEIILNQSRLVISRSGYSTLMDLEKLDLNAILIPTPGQTEQIYLANRIKERLKYNIGDQEKLSNIGPTIDFILNKKHG